MINYSQFLNPGYPVTKTPSKKAIIYIFAVIFLGTSCNSSNESVKENTSSTSKDTVSALPSRTAYQQTIDGKGTDLYLLKNKNNMQAAITNYGGRLVSLLVPGEKNNLVDVVVGFDSVQQYTKSTEPYFGATIGRYGNRIAKGKFKLDGKVYTLFTNNGPNTLHGGKKGFQYVVWDAILKGDSVLELTYQSKDMEEGFPGNLSVKVTYTLTDDNELKIDYEASTDKKTVVNLTNHAFYNLNGQGSGTINDHILTIDGDEYTPVDSTLIPFGKNEPVINTPFDFRKPASIGSRVNSNHLQLQYGKGYDHNYVLNAHTAGGMNHAATVIGDKTNIKMDVYTQEPGLQFYGGNFMQSKNTIKGGHKDDFRTAFCLETQHFPDSPNQPSFPSTILEPGKIYKTSTVYKFSVQKK
jgi:aldose 1-epimerase